MPNAPVPAAAEGLPSSRRGFLRRLTTLPLIGGGITLIGAPTAVAEPVTTDLLVRYLGFLGREFAEAHDELLRREPAFVERSRMLLAARGFVSDRYLFRTFSELATDAIVEAAPASTRAALVLATVGCDWREGGR